MTYSPTLVPLDLALIANTPHLAKVAVQQVLDVHGRIDILINNAGVSMRGTAIDTQHIVDR
jgi:dehydrogenase/reductase SDR family protein 7B